MEDFYTFTNAAPDGRGASASSAAEANNNHTAYQGGMSAWCGNCHGDFHANNTKLIHPSGETMGASIAQNYNLYNGTEDVRGGTQATAYLAAVPFEDAAMTTSSTAGPTPPAARSPASAATARTPPRRRTPAAGTSR